MIHTTTLQQGRANNKDYEIYKELKDTYTYPVEGWEWKDEEPK